MESAIENKYQKATKDGRLYITTNDFFKQKEIQKKLRELKNSSIYKSIESRREK